LASEIEDLLEQAILVASKIDRASVKSAAYTDIASIYQKTGRHERCLEILADALHMADSLQRPEEKAIQLAWLARIYHIAGDTAKSQELFTRAILLARATETPAQKAGALYQIVHEYLDAVLLFEAETIISELHELCVKPENGLDTVSELISLADICFIAGISGKALPYLEEALQTASTAKDNWIKAQHLSSIAELYSEMGESSRAMEVLEQAILATGSVDAVNHSYFLLRISATYALIDRKKEACNILTTALSIVNQDEIAFSKCSDLIKIAEIFAGLGDKIEADKLLNQIREIAGNIEDEGDRINSYIQLGRLLDALDEHQNALETANQALDLCQTLENQRTLIFLLGDISLLFIELTQPEKAAEIIGRIIGRVTNPRLKTSGLAILASDLAEANQRQLALLLTGVIQEPGAKANALISLARSLVESEAVNPAFGGGP
jgi:tetratricopeptide (TPR) repeat protein